MSSTPMLTVLDEDRHWWFASRTRAILAYLDRYVGPGQDLQVLDVGCGAANMTHHLRHYGHVVGVDNNPKPLEIARERGLEAYQGTADNLPFDDGAFDVITLLDTVEHVPAEDNVFEECRRVLRGPDAAHDMRGGKLLVTVPAFMFLWSKNDVINMHQRRYTAPELRGKLERHGFRVLRVVLQQLLHLPVGSRRHPAAPRPGRARTGLTALRRKIISSRNGTRAAADELGVDGRRQSRDSLDAPCEPALRHLDHRDRGKTLAQAAVHQSSSSNLPRSSAVWLPRTRTRFSSKMSSSVCVAPCWVVSPPQ